jgi:hypothetical protein
MPEAENHCHRKHSKEGASEKYNLLIIICERETELLKLQFLTAIF